MTTLLIGTAGHVDHGKTSLLEALTGIDCDRLPEEKRRGITLDLGFAHLERDGVELGFIDVPGHERFLHNALAGLGGIRLLLLVVAADEGVRPQTREHLAIAELLDIPDAIVAITKCDLADDELAGLVELEIAELLAPTRWAGAHLFRVSSATGAGVEALAAELARRAHAAGPHPFANAPVRLSIDRAFAPKGQGVVVTGTLARGTVKVGDELRLEPSGSAVRVRSLQVHGRGREAVEAGSRVALQLGGVALEHLTRGDELLGAGGARTTRTLLARIRLQPDSPVGLDRPREVRLHLMAGETPARVRPLAPVPLLPGAEGLVVVRTPTPIVARRGDRIVIRRLSPAATLGGGEILDPHWNRPRRVELEARLAALSGDDRDAIRAWAAAAAESGVDAEEIAARLGAGVPAAKLELDRLAASGRLLAAASRWFAPERLAATEERVKQLLADYFARDRMADSMPKAELVRRLLPARARMLSTLVDFHLGWLQARKVLIVDGDRVALPGRKAQLSSGESGLAAAIVSEYERSGLEPPAPSEVARRLAAKPEIVEGLVKHLVARGRLARIPGALVISTAALQKLAADLRATGWEKFSVPQFKERFGLSRKWAIPLLEQLDSIGVTRRAGDLRLLPKSETIS